MEYVLTTNNLTKRYRNFQALSSLSMHVEKGAIYGVVGRTERGRRTLIRLICGLQKPTEGSYTLYGRTVKAMTERVRRRSGGGG